MSWADVVTTVGKWYEKNVHTYQEKWSIPCNISGCGKVRDDCSGFVSACLRAAGMLPAGVDYSSTEYTKGKGATALEKAGFKKYPWPGWDNVLPYDIMTYCGHIEIYAGKSDRKRSWSWGSVHDGLPTKKRKSGQNPGMPSGIGDKPIYTYIWRLGSPAPPISNPYVDSNLPNGSNDYTFLPENNYDTISSNVDNAVFTNSMLNGMSITTNVSMEAEGKKRTRIYCALEPTIIVDELSIALDPSTSQKTVSENATAAEQTTSATAGNDATTPTETI